MSNAGIFVFNGDKYSSEIEEGQVVRIKRFNEKYGMWVVIIFSAFETNAEFELLDLLTKEYFKQALSEEQLINVQD